MLLFVSEAALPVVVLTFISSKLSFLPDAFGTSWAGYALVAGGSRFPNADSKGSSFGFSISCTVD